MKGVISFLFLFVFSVSAHSLEPNCHLLFDISRSIPFDYNAYMPKESTQEKALREEVQKRELVKPQGSSFRRLEPFQLNTEKFKLENYQPDNSQLDNSRLDNQKIQSMTVEQKNLKDAIRVMEDYYMTTYNIRKNKPDAQVQFRSQFSLENRKRFMEAEAGVLFRVAELLTAKGIQYSLSEGKIFINPEGDHYLNRFADRVFKKKKLIIAISMRDLVEGGASGLHFAVGLIELHPHILLQDSLFQDGIALHEYTHFLDLGKVGMKTDRPYQASIKIEKTDPETAKDLGIYRTQFSVDEIRAYRTSLRNNVHRALTAKTREEFSLNYNQIKHDLKTELVFSEITEKVYRKLLLDRDASPNLSPLKRIRERAMGGKVVSLSEVEQYKVIEEYGHDSRSTYEMAKFTSQLFDILNDKLPKNEDVSYEVKYEFVKRMARVLSLPEVRNLKGEYPSMELIEEIFQQ